LTERAVLRCDDGGPQRAVRDLAGGLVVVITAHSTHNLRRMVMHDRQASANIRICRIPRVRRSSSRRHESCVGCRLRRSGQVERIGRSATICSACPSVRTPMVGRAPRRPAWSSTGPRLRRYGQVSAQQGRAPLDRPLEAPINLKPMHHAFHGDDGHCVRLRHIFAWANRS
jgi:hypothetical protein